MEKLHEIWQHIVNIFSFKLVNIGSTPLTLSSICLFLLVLFGLLYVSHKITLFLEKKLPRKRLNDNAIYIASKLIRYVLFSLSIIVSIQIIGISLTSLAVIFGFLSVGIGFGLQNITSNFISGVVLLFEQPIKIGDHISVDDVDGYVKEIKIRSTTIQTLDERTIIIPNSHFIESKVTNWSYGSQRLRIKVNIGVSYDSDLDLVMRSLLEVAAEHPDVLDDPKPVVRFVEFGDSSWNLFLAGYVNSISDYYSVTSDLHCSIVHKFRENNIDIPFPQRDLRIIRDDVVDNLPASDQI